MIAGTSDPNSSKMPSMKQKLKLRQSRPSIPATGSLDESRLLSRAVQQRSADELIELAVRRSSVVVVQRAMLVLPLGDGCETIADQRPPATLGLPAHHRPARCTQRDPTWRSCPSSGGPPQPALHVDFLSRWTPERASRNTAFGGIHPAGSTASDSDALVRARPALPQVSTPQSAIRPVVRCSDPLSHGR
jgi:hypothetical protein